MTAPSTCRNELSTSIDPLRRQIFQGVNSACFIERERVLRQLAGEQASIDEGKRYTTALARLLDSLSCPIEAGDIFLGRMVEGRLSNDEKSQPVATILQTHGHMTLDWPTLLRKGLEHIAQEAEANARRIQTDDARLFAGNVRDAVDSVTRFARRYADSARCRAESATEPGPRDSLLRAAAALERAPAGPATDFFSALQSIWFLHLITSCCVGSRDFAFGRMDQYLYPYYRRDLAEGVLDRDAARLILAHFFIKTNEITGTTTWNFQGKPIPSNATKQYLIIGGTAPDGRSEDNDLSLLILEAARLVRLPEPVITVRLSAHTPADFRLATATVARDLSGQIHFYNDDIIIPGLKRCGMPDTDAYNYSMVGCCRVDIPGKMDSGFMQAYQYHNALAWLMTALNDAPDTMDSMETILAQFSRVVRRELEKAATRCMATYSNQTPRQFHLESILLDGCVENCRDNYAGGTRYWPQGYNLGGIASIGNILAAIQYLVFEQRRMSLSELLAIAAADFANHEPLRREIRSLPKFGNDMACVDTLTRRAATVLLDAVDAIRCPLPHFVFAAFYSLDQHHNWGNTLPGTPDGRIRGEPVSENQSPTYGTDTAGLTALLSSVSRLPQTRTIMGGMNVKFAGHIPADKIAAILETYFKMDGLHLGFNFIDRNTLWDAQKNPDNYRSLCVRLYGFSEYFVSLSPHEQNELIQRTEQEIVR